MVDAVSGPNAPQPKNVLDLLAPKPKREKPGAATKRKIDSNRAKLAQAKLAALRMAAHAAAARGDAQAARRIAAEAHAIGRDLGRLADAAGGTSLEEIAEAQAIRSGVDEARGVIAAARKAAKPGSREDRDMLEMEGRIEGPVDETV